MQQALSSVLFPVYRRRVLGLLLLAPDEALHGREIARRTGLPSGTVVRELNRLRDAGLLKREQRGYQSLYSADRTCPIFAEVAGILRKTSGAAAVIASALAPLWIESRQPSSTDRLPEELPWQEATSTC